MFSAAGPGVIATAGTKAAGFVTTAIEFATGTAYVTATDPGLFAADSDKFTMSFWFTSAADTGEGIIFSVLQSAPTTSSFVVYITGADVINFRTGSGGPMFQRTTTTFNRTDEAWHHVLYSWNNGTPQCYIDGISETLTDTTSNTGNINFSTSTDDPIIGAADTAGDRGHEGAISELYLMVGTQIDLSVQANREKFYSATGKAVDLGIDGSTPTGGAPELYWRGNIADDKKNEGSGPNFDASAGTSAAATSPPT